MDQKEHVATLAALGTVGLAATGLALGTNEGSVYSTRPGKRKWPGSTITSTSVPQTPFQDRRAISQPVSLLLSQENTPSTSRSSLFRRKASGDILDATQGRDEGHYATQSRDSSKSRRSVLRPWTSDTKNSSDRSEVGTGSSWLKRMSSLSSNHGSSPASSLRHENRTIMNSSPSSVVRPGTTDTLPNKLVKRATSQRALSFEHAKGQILRRPATSHQRSRTYSEMLAGSNEKQEDSSTFENRANGRPETATTTPIWRPFFESDRPRKRRQSEVFTDVQQIKTIITPYLRCATLVLGSNVEQSSQPEDTEIREDFSPPLFQSSAPSGRHKLRRSMNSIRRSARRRNFTDPTVQVLHADANGTFSPIVKDSPLSPVSHVSTFDIELPRGTPVFSSSPPPSTLENGFTFRKRASLSPSELNTTSSDNDTRIFTDDDSLEFKSDTAYDSIATRATSGSHSGLRISKLETIFAERTSDEIDNAGLTLESLMQNASLNDQEMPDVESDIQPSDVPPTQNQLVIEQVSNLNMRAATPVRSISSDMEDTAATPVPKKASQTQDFSSPPLLPSTLNTKSYNNVGDMVEDMDVDINEENIDWSPAADSYPQRGSSEKVSAANTSTFPRHLQFAPPVPDSKRSSIFDWSEQQQPANSPRPKTVHGNQGNENRSRSSGRKEMHLRSQSVPVSRDGPNEEVPPSVSKYGTWGLGNKPVSEEWSDDFDFDDTEDSKTVFIQPNDLPAGSRDSIRSVKVPQAIIDRQASVHLQFGQVQEFMLLVEELKRLRVRAITLHLLDGHSKQLWEDADSIINLATINEEENALTQPTSPASSDIFADDVQTTNRQVSDQLPLPETKRHSGTRRSVSSAATTPQTGRARGESLAQAKNFLQTIHQNRTVSESSPLDFELHQQKKLPFDTQDLRDLVVRSGVITRALKEIVRKAEGVAVSPQKTPPKPKDPPFSHIFNVPEDPEASPCPPFRKPGLPKSRSANSYLEISTENKQSESVTTRLTLAAMV